MSHLKPAVLIAVLGFALIPWLAQIELTSSTAEQTNWESGRASITISSYTEASVAQTVTFPTPFMTPPNITLTQIDPIGGLVGTPATQYRYVAGVFLATDPPAIWTAMPVAQTELFGNTNHEVRIDDVNVASSLGIQFQVTITTADASGTAVLRPQYFSGAWNDVTGCDINISTIGAKIAYCAIPATVAASFLWRVSGLNGDGVSSPAFTNISINIARKNQSVTLWLINSPTNPIMTTQFKWAIVFYPGVSSGTFYISWTATICTNGGVSC